MLGYSRNELLSMSISDIHPEEMSLLIDFKNEVLIKGSSWTNELTCKTKNNNA